MTLTRISPADARSLIDQGARLVDVRDPDEHARERIVGAETVPLSRLSELAGDDRPIIFHCRSGARTSAHAGALRNAAAQADCYMLEGGLDAWRKAGLATHKDASQPIEIIRQVHLVAGSLILLGVLLALTVDPRFALLSGFVGAGLTFAGATGWCGMAMLLRQMPWNRAALAA